MDEFGRIRLEIWKIFHELPETIKSEGFERQHDGKIAPPREIVATLRDGTRLRYTRKSNGANKWRYEKDGWYARRCGGGWAKWGETAMIDECKWMQDEVCVNADCPACADYCPVANTPGVCKYEERGNSDAQKGKRQTGAK